MSGILFMMNVKMKRKFRNSLGVQIPKNQGSDPFDTLTHSLKIRLSVH